MSAFVYTGENEYLYLFIDDTHRDILWWKENHWKMRIKSTYTNNHWHVQALTHPENLGLSDDAMQWYDLAIAATQHLKEHQARILDELDTFQLDDIQTEVPIMFQRLLENPH